VKGCRAKSTKEEKKKKKKSVKLEIQEICRY